MRTPIAIDAFAFSLLPLSQIQILVIFKPTFVSNEQHASTCSLVTCVCSRLALGRGPASNLMIIFLLRLLIFKVRPLCHGTYKIAEQLSYFLLKPGPV